MALQCSGVLSRTKLEEFLTGPPFEVELHDRDRRADIIKPLPKIFDIHGNEEHLFDTSGKFIILTFTYQRTDVCIEQ